MISRSHTTDDERRHALYSDDERHRYSLSIRWGKGKTVAFIGLNPSTATEKKDDRTIAKLKRWAKANGFGMMVMLNAYSFRSTDPKGLWQVSDPTDEANDVSIGIDCYMSDVVVACWGTNIKSERHSELMDMIESMKCFHITQHGHPGHPLYLKEPMTLKTYQRSYPE